MTACYHQVSMMRSGMNCQIHLAGQSIVRHIGPVIIDVNAVEERKSIFFPRFYFLLEFS